MKPPGAYKIAHRSPHRAGLETGANGSFDAFVAPLLARDRRAQRILESLRSEIVEGGCNLRIRQVFQTPREIYRVELELPELGYQRTTLLDRDALEELLEAEEVRAVVSEAALGR